MEANFPKSHVLSSCYTFSLSLSSFLHLCFQPPFPECLFCATPKARCWGVGLQLCEFPRWNWVLCTEGRERPLQVYLISKETYMWALSWATKKQVDFCTKIFKVFIETLTGFNCMFTSDGLNNTLLAHDCILENGSGLRTIILLSDSMNLLSTLDSTYK